MTKRQPDWSLGAFLARERNVHTSGGRRLLLAALLAGLAIEVISVILAFVAYPR